MIFYYLFGICIAGIIMAIVVTIQYKLILKIKRRLDKVEEREETKT
jgi:hypothetical protein